MRKFLLVLSGLVAAGAAQADGHRFAASDPLWKAECGSCHVAYPPQLLPPESWSRIMSRLGRHFGTDASLDAPAAASIMQFLTANASRRNAAPAGDEPRISQTAWFTREHRKVPRSTWSDPAVRSAANCAACHTRAEQADYSERTLRLPR